MTGKLLPCPFCGKRLERNTAFSTRRQDHYSHPPLEEDEEPCMLEHVNVVEYLDDRHAAGQGNSDRWNRRTPPPQPRAVGSDDTLRSEEEATR